MRLVCSGAFSDGRSWHTAVLDAEACRAIVWRFEPNPENDGPLNAEACLSSILQKKFIMASHFRNSEKEIGVRWQTVVCSINH